VHWEALSEQRLVLGLSYQSPPGGWDEGMRYEGTLRTNFGTGVNRDKIHLDQTFPDIIQAGLRTRPIPGWELRLSANYQRFSVVRGQCLARAGSRCRVSDDGTVGANAGAFANYVRRWHDTFGARVASSVFVREVHEVFAAVSFDGTAIPDSTLEPGLPDGNDLGFTLGANLRLTKTLDLGLSYMFLYMLPRDNRGKSIVSDFAAPTHLPSADGQYTGWMGMANISLRGHYDL
jgi:long-subunit fatty acid transport protein